MRAFVINLARRRDRLARLTAQLASLDVTYSVVDAIDASATPASHLAWYFAENGPLGRISSGDMACTLSHLRAICAFYRSELPYGIICEDDVVFSPQAGIWMTQAGWIPAGVDLIKLERFGPASQCVVVANMLARGDRWLARLLSKHCGAGAYIVSRFAAHKILEVAREPLMLPIDHLLFNPSASPLPAALMPWQLMPAIAQQDKAMGTDIAITRKNERPRGLEYLRREAVRAYFEIRRIPAQIGGIVIRHADLRHIAFR